VHNAHVWGWEIPLYLFLGGMAAGVMIIASLLQQRIAPERQSRVLRLLPFAVPLILSTGMLALFLDLDHKLHVFRFYTAFRMTSPMSWGAWILLAIYPATILAGIARLTAAEARRLPGSLVTFAAKHVTRLAQLNIALGIALGAYTGILLATLGAHVLWGSMLLAPLFLVSGVSAGAALAMLLPVTEEEHALLLRWDIAAILGEAALLAFFFIDLVGRGEAGRVAASLFFGGAYTATFWAFVVIAGLAVPLLLELYESKRHVRAVMLAPGLLLIGGLALRWIFVVAGQQ
jgi:formate-dependent nitrite reductase membrane component NrfD